MASTSRRSTTRLRRDLPRVARSQRGRAARPAARARRLPALQPPLRGRAPAPVEEHASPGGSRDHRAGGEQVRPGRRPRSGHLSARRRGLAHRRWPTIRSRSRRRSSTRWPCRAGAATRCSPACTRPTRRCPPRLKARLDGRRGVFTYGGRRKTTALLNPEDRDWNAGRPSDHPPASGDPGARRSTSIRQDSGIEGTRGRRSDGRPASSRGPPGSAARSSCGGRRR